MSDPLDRDEADANVLTKARRHPTVKAKPSFYPAQAEPSPRPANAPTPLRKPPVEDDDEESFIERHRIGIMAGVLVLAGGTWFYFHPPARSDPVRKAPEPTVVRIQLLPPPPPPPPKIQPPPPKEAKRTDETPVAKPEPQPEAPRPKPEDKPPEGLGTNVKGSGPGMAGLGSSGNGMLGGTGTGGGGGGMAKWYAGQVGTKVAEALRNHRKTRAASLRVNVQVWLDATGRIARATLEGSTGDSSLDAALTNEVLAGIQLSEPPPKGMRMPIPLRLTARQANY